MNLLVEIFSNLTHAHYFVTRKELLTGVPRSWTEIHSLDFRYKQTVFIGTGNDSNITDEAIKRTLKVHGEPVVFLDNWVNFDRRFQENPAYILVSDPWAREYAENCFPKFEIKSISPKRAKILPEGTFVEKVLLLGSPKNNYTLDEFERHDSGGGCLCPELDISRKHFPNAELFVKPHPKSKIICGILGKAKLIRQPLELLIQPKIVAIGRPSYAHYYLESRGVPAFFTEKVNENWHGPLFRVLT